MDTPPPPLPPPLRILDLENGYDAGWLHANCERPATALPSSNVYDQHLSSKVGNSLSAQDSIGHGSKPIPPYPDISRRGMKRKASSSPPRELLTDDRPTSPSPSRPFTPLSFSSRRPSKRGVSPASSAGSHVSGVSHPPGSRKRRRATIVTDISSDELLSSIDKWDDGHSPFESLSSAHSKLPPLPSNSTRRTSHHTRDRSQQSPMNYNIEGARPRLSVRCARDPPKNPEGQIYCDHPECQAQPPTFLWPCEWNKHMDNHDRPYKCYEPGCDKIQGFTYSGGLLRHQREVHKKTDAKKPLMCPYADCNRSTRNGFTRQDNLQEHLRRRHMHTDDTPQGLMVEMSWDRANELEGVRANSLPATGTQEMSPSKMSIPSILNFPESPSDATSKKPIQTTSSLPKAPSTSNMGGVYICDCCPNKPNKFDNPNDLCSHKMEKRYFCQYCNHSFRNKDEAERHQNALHLRHHSWSCAALPSFQAAFYSSTSLYCPINTGPLYDSCGYCGEEFPNFPRPDWDRRFKHLTIVHRFGECNNAKKFFRADHFRQHLKHSHAGTSGRWVNILENACMKEEQSFEPTVKYIA